MDINTNNALSSQLIPHPEPKVASHLKLTSLPSSMILEIFSHLEAENARNLVLTCKQFCVLISNNESCAFFLNRKVFDPLDKPSIFPVPPIHLTFFQSAIRDKCIVGVQRFIDNYRIDFKSQDFQLYFKDAISGNCPEIVKMFLQKGFNLSADNQAINTTVIEGFGDILTILIQDGRIDPTLDNHVAIKNAMISNRFEIVKILLTDPRVNPCDALQWASENNQIEIVKLILKTHGIGTQLTLADALVRAIDKGNFEVFKLLYEHDFSMTKIIGDQIFLSSIIAKKSDVLDFLLKDERLELKNSYDITLALMKRDFYAGVEFLIKEDRFDFSFNGHMAIQYAMTRNRVFNVKMLLLNDKMWTSADKQKRLELYEFDTTKDKNGFYLGVFELLVKEKDFKLYEDSNYSIIGWFCIDGMLNIIKLLLSSQKIDFKSIINRLEQFSFSEHLEILRLIIEHQDGSLNSESYHNILNENIRGNCFEAVKLLLASKRNDLILNKGTLLNLLDTNDVIRSMFVERGLLNEIDSPTIQILRRKFKDEIRNKNNSFVEFLHKNFNFEFDDTFLTSATHKNNFEIIKKILECERVDPVLIKVIIKSACQEGNLELIKLLLTRAEAELPEDALILAIERNHTQLANFLLSQPKFNPFFKISLLFKNAIIKENIDIIKKLFADERMKSLMDENALIDNFIPKTELEQLLPKIVKMILSDKHLQQDDFIKIMDWAIKKGYLEIVKHLMHAKEITCANSLGHRLQLACGSGHTDIVEFLLKYQKSDYFKLALTEACECKRTETIKLLLSHENCAYSHSDVLKVLKSISDSTLLNALFLDKRLDINLDDNKVFEIAIEKASEATIKILLANPNLTFSLNPKRFVTIACKNNRIDALRILLNDERICLSGKDFEPLQCSIDAGYTEIIKFLIADGKIDLAERNFYAIRKASEKGLHEIVEILLNHKNVSPSAKNNEAIRLASKNGHDLSVKLLIENPKVNPAANHNEAIKAACLNGHISVVALLLADSRVDASDNDNEAFSLAVRNNHLKVVSLLLKQPGLKLDKQIIEFYRENSNYPNTESLLELLLADERIQFGDDHINLIHRAIACGHINLVRLHLDKGFDPTHKNNELIRSACFYNQNEIAKILLQDQRVNPCVNNNEALRLAEASDNHELVSLLRLRMK